MARYKKNVKRIDPRYFLHETVDRDGLKISRGKLKEIVLEEFNNVLKEDDELDEGWLDRMVARGKGLGTQAGGHLKGMAQAGVGKAATAVGLGDEEEFASTAAATKAAAAERGEAVKGLHIVKTSYKEFENDLRKVGLDKDPDIKEILTRLRTAMRKLEARSAGE